MPVHLTDTDNLDRIVQCLLDGGVPILPTDTLYGIHASVFRPEALARVREIKGVSPGRPLITLAKPGHFESLGIVIPLSLKGALESVWPAPLTIILPAQNSDLFPQGNVAVRYPDSQLWEQLFSAGAPPVISTSANLSGMPTCIDPSDLDPEIVEKVDLILDLGPLPQGMPSTLLDLSTPTPRLMREGAYRVTEELMNRLKKAAGEM